MAEDDEGARRAAGLLHLRGQALEKGEPLPPPLVLAAMFHLPGDPSGHPAYGRTDNPTWEALEHALGHLEGAGAVAFPSGMAAISAALFSTLNSGDRILIPSDGYYVTRLLSGILSRYNVLIDQRPTASFAEGGFAGYRAVYLETPSNPGLDLCDIAAIAAAARAEGALVIADNTTMTPLGQRPLDLGADIVVAADTKAPGGHSDVLMGHAATRDPALLQALRDWRRIAGAIPGPFEAWLTHRSLETLEVRFQRMCDSAETIAARLAETPGVGVRYPGLPSHPHHGLARRQMVRAGFLIGLTLPSAAAADAFIAACPLLRPATSFGGVHSSAERRARWGDAVAPGYVRLSVGCEPPEALWPALEGAMKTALA